MKDLDRINTAVRRGSFGSGVAIGRVTVETFAIKFRGKFKGLRSSASYCGCCTFCNIELFK